MAHYSFRAECAHDVAQFQSACDVAGVTVALTLHPDELLPDVDVGMESPASLDELRNVMRKVEDGHVMLQTLRQCLLKDNSLALDFEIE